MASVTRDGCVDLTHAQSHELTRIGMIDPKAKVIASHPQGPLLVRGNGDWEIVNKVGTRRTIARGWLSRGRRDEERDAGSKPIGI